MFNIDLRYKSATPMKLIVAQKPGSKKSPPLFPLQGVWGFGKLLHPPSCTLDAVKVLKDHG